jgi:hypothetical protein
LFLRQVRVEGLKIDTTKVKPQVTLNQLSHANPWRQRLHILLTSKNNGCRDESV